MEVIVTEPTTITLSLSEDENKLIQSLAEEQGFDTPEAAIKALLQDAVQVYDTIWDSMFEASQDLLEQLADEAHAEYEAGLTNEFDPDKEPDL